ncbi:MAG: HAMP domain-containing histidine kinase [Bacteroidetes bacterium]|nr:HAMP domain-containing histidine kinase [Bacteroidota bacterium]
MNEDELIKKEKEITELQNTINALNSKLNESESLKSNFISNIMNEVYNPFSSIISMADNILSLNENKLHNAIPMAEIIYREAAQLDFHLQNIFVAATIEAGLEGVELSIVNLNNIMETVIKKFKFDINNKNIKIVTNLSIDRIINITSDAKKITLVLLNLLSNSIKNSPNNGEIKIHFELIEDELNIAISDQGSGISETEMEIIFDRFKKIDETINSVKGGTGLGLSVVKAIIEILEGNISFSKDNGTKVILNLPNMENNHSKFGFDDDDVLFDQELF